MTSLLAFLLGVFILVWVVAGLAIILGIGVALVVAAKESKRHRLEEPWRESLRPDEDDE